MKAGGLAPEVYSSSLLLRRRLRYRFWIRPGRQHGFSKSSSYSDKLPQSLANSVTIQERPQLTTRSKILTFPGDAGYVSPS